MPGGRSTSGAARRDPSIAIGITRAPTSVPYGHDARAAAVRRVADVMTHHLRGLSVRAASEIWTREVDFWSLLTGPEDLYDSCSVTIGSALDSLRTGRLSGHHVTRIRGLGRAASEQGIPLELVLRALRVDFLVLWGEMLLVARTTDAGTLQSLLNASELVWGAVDAVNVELTVGYRSNESEEARAEARRRQALLHRLLDGESVDVDDLRGVLGLEPDDTMVVVVASGDTVASHEELARTIRYSSMHSVWCDRNGTITGVVAVRGERASAARSVLERLGRLRAGISQPVDNIGGLSGARHEAELALASIRPGVTEMVSIFDNPIAVLVAAQPSLALSLTQGLLAGILDRPAREREVLLQTIVTFDDSQGSVALTSERLFCHRNTVLNRLARISELTGMSTTAPTDMTALAMAAHVVRSGWLTAQSA
jgi:hypothetical protein